MNRRKGLYERFVKRLIDVVCSGLALIALSPLLLITAVLVRIKLGTPVIFMQERPGKNEQIFKLYKFRSMRDATGKDGRPLPDDERLTSFGRKLRSTSIDELPELWNIFRGDMSIVGPRPLLVEYLPYYTKEEKHRHDVKPGLTGLAQVNGRNTLTWEEKFDYDLRYIQNITFGQDAAIVFHTVEKVFKRADILIGKQFKVGKLTEERKNWVLTPEGAGKPEDAVCEENAI